MFSEKRVAPRFVLVLISVAAALAAFGCGSLPLGPANTTASPTPSPSSSPADQSPTPPLSPSPGGSPTGSPSPGASPTAIPTVTPFESATPSPPSGGQQPSPTPGNLSSSPGSSPSDTRIVVNIPAYRMDIFDNGHLTKSYKIGIGYPEFPLPSGLRSATNIIFNPSWTPPDEEWVRKSQKIQAGKKIPAGDKLNPLGPIKIPIGLPNLIHGGKAPASLGGFDSHGCVGLTDDQVRDFAKRLADVSGTKVSDIDILKYGMKPTVTRTVKLNNAVPVELRYETIAVVDGKLHIYRDVYEQGTNTKENLSTVLGAYGVSLNQLSRAEMTRVNAALKQMSRDVPKAPSGHVTRAIKGKRDIEIPIASLAGKGYPPPATGE